MNAADKARPTPRPAPKPNPKPSRAALDDAERAIEKAQAAHDDVLTKLRQREKALREKPHVPEKGRKKITTLEPAASNGRASYEKALKEWRS